jgi:uncharacterized protein
MRPTALAIYIDANVAIYSGGGPHPLKEPCSDFLEFVSQRAWDFVTCAEVLQELLHVYMARGAWPTGRRVFDSFAELMSGRIEAVLAADVRAAAELATEYPTLDGRDLVHVAVMTRLGANQIVSTDKGFDRIPDIERLDPARFSEWRNSRLA